MKKTAVIFLSTMLFAAGFTGCAQATVQSPAQSQSAPQSSSAQPQAMTAEHQPTELSYWSRRFGYGRGMLNDGKGMLYQNYYRQNAALETSVFIRKYDIKTDETGFLCSKQGCAHTDAACQAYRENNEIFTLALPDYFLELRMQVDEATGKRNPEMWLTDYETAEIKKQPFDCSFLNFPYTLIMLADDKSVAWDKQFLYAMLYAENINMKNGVIEQEANYLVRINLQTGACEPVYNSGENKCWIMGVLGNSLVVARWDRHRIAMPKDPNDPNAVFYEIITLPLDGSPETIHRMAPDYSETFCYDGKTHALYFVSYGRTLGEKNIYHSDGIVYKQDLFTDAKTKLAQLPPPSKGEGNRNDILLLTDGHLLLAQNTSEENVLYAVSQQDGSIQEITLQNPGQPPSLLYPDLLTQDTAIIASADGSVYVLRTEDLWANKPAFIKKPGLEKFCITLE